MKRTEIAPGAFITTIEGDKFKRAKVAVHLVVPGTRQNATALALLPHVLDRRCAAVPDPTKLSRLLYSLYGADVTSESYTAGPNRVLTLGVSGLKNEYALAGEDLAANYLDLVCNLLFAPVLENGVFAKGDVAIEKGKQADYLRSEMNDKRSYCLRQARRKLFGASPLGIESAGYLEDLDAVTPQSLFESWQALLCGARVEVMVCGVDEEAAAAKIRQQLDALPRKVQDEIDAPALALPQSFEHFSEAMPTTQGKLAIMLCGGARAGAKGEAVMRLASALYGGLPTSRLFMNVREKQSLCYYCSSSYGYFSDVLTVDSGIDHKNAHRASQAILKELADMQGSVVTVKELNDAKKYMRSVFSSAKDSPDALMNFAFNERLKGFDRSLDELSAQCDAVTAEEIQTALSAYVPAVQYVITAKEGA